MENSTFYLGGNQLLDTLPKQVLHTIKRHLVVRHDDNLTVLCWRHDPIEAMYFPISAVYSTVVELEEGVSVEVDTVGRRGVLNADFAIDAPGVERTVICHEAGSVALLGVAGAVLALSDAAFTSQIRRSIRQQAFTAQQDVACNACHTAAERCARWILNYRHQTGREIVPFVSDGIGSALKLSRDEIREAASVLVDAGAIIGHGDGLTASLSVRDRSLLLELSCDCFAVARLSELFTR